MKLQQYGFNPKIIPENSMGIPACITTVHRNLFEFVCDFGIGFAHLKTGEYYAGDEKFPTTGDFVMLDWQESGESRILQTLPRKTFISRLDPSSTGNWEQTIAANFDYVFILQSLDRDFNDRRLERYLTLAWQSGAVPVVVLTKADKLKDYSTQLLIAEQTAIGVDVFAVSVKTACGLEQFDNYLKPGKTLLFFGSSGVGKSSLVNALADKGIMATASIREKDCRGRHTTSLRQLISLKNGTMVIDTPEMRELGMWDTSEGLSKSFADIESYFGQCKFSDCRHQNEPGCAIKAAIRQGQFSNAHWESYLRLSAQSRYTEDKAGYLRDRKQVYKHLTKLYRKSTREDYRNSPCTESFICKVCNTPVNPEGAGSRHRNHCPQCLSSTHVDNKPGDRASLCKGIMDTICVWVRNDGEWAIIHRCRSCGTLSSNRIAADDDLSLLMEIATKPMSNPPCPL